MVELSGSLAGMSLMPMLRLLSELRQTGSLQLSRNGWSAQLDLRDGRVVGASFADERGLSALTALGLVMHDADFVYLEGPPPVVEELDLTPDRLRRHFETEAGIGMLALDTVPRPTDNSLELAFDDDEFVLHRSTVRLLLAIDGRRTLGEILGRRPSSVVLLDLAHLVKLGLIGLEPAPWRPRVNGLDDDLTGAAQLALPRPPAVSHLDGVSHELATQVACPKLGFADNPAAHFARPTAVHRCYASGSGQLVSTLEQREYCLSGQYATCPRLRSFPERVAVKALSSSQIAEPPADVAAPPVAGRRSRSDRLLPAVSIGLALLAVAAGFAAFVQPRLSQPVSLLTVTAAPTVQMQPTIQTQPTVQTPTGQTPPTVVTQPTIQTQPTPQPTSPPTIQMQPTVQAQAPAEVQLSVQAPPTREPTSPPTVLPRAAPATASQSGQGSVLLLDAQFSRPQLGWPDNPPFVAWADGAYHMSARTPGRFVAVAAPLVESVGDVFVNATFHKVGGPDGGGYGLIVRDQEPAARDGSNQTGHFYVFEVGDRGELGVWRRDGDRWTDVVSWTPSPLVQPGRAANELNVRIVGDQITFQINGTDVMTQTDHTLFAGGVGLFVGGDGNNVAVDRFTVTAPGEGPH